VHIKQRVTRIVSGKDIEHLTIEIEFENEVCLMNEPWQSHEHD
jgi:hypothetical protein